MGQLVIRIDDATIGAIDGLVGVGRYESRSDVVRSALAEFLDLERRAEIGRQIAESYRLNPQTDAQVASAHASAKAMIEEEPWDDF